jgi:hypothetical protein
MTLSNKETGNILQASQEQGYIPSIRPTSEKAPKYGLRRAMVYINSTKTHQKSPLIGQMLVLI